MDLYRGLQHFGPEAASTAARMGLEFTPGNDLYQLPEHAATGARGLRTLMGEEPGQVDPMSLEAPGVGSRLFAATPDLLMSGLGYAGAAGDAMQYGAAAAGPFAPLMAGAGTLLSAPSDAMRAARLMWSRIGSAFGPRPEVTPISGMWSPEQGGGQLELPGVGRSETQGSKLLKGNIHEDDWRDLPPGHPFYSPLERAVEADTQLAYTPQVLQGRARKRTGVWEGVKKGEVDYTGLGDEGAVPVPVGGNTADGRIPKERVQEYVNEEGIKFEEVNGRMSEGTARWTDKEWRFTPDDTYEEFQLTLDPRRPGSAHADPGAERYTGGHYGSNVVVHMRGGEMNGKWHTDEVQSDWDTALRKYGPSHPKKGAFNQAKKLLHERRQQLEQRYRHFIGGRGGPLYFNSAGRENALPHEVRQSQEERGINPDVAFETAINADPVYRQREREVDRLEKLVGLGGGFGTVPDMPYRDQYVQLGFRRMVKEGIDRGFNTFTWTTAQQQVDRYDESYRKLYEMVYDTTGPEHLRKWAKQDYGVDIKPRRVESTFEKGEGDGNYTVRDDYGNVIDDGYDTEDEALEAMYNMISEQAGGEIERVYVGARQDGGEEFFQSQAGLDDWINDNSWTVRQVDDPDEPMEVIDKWDVLDGDGDVIETFDSEDAAFELADKHQPWDVAEVNGDRDGYYRYALSNDGDYGSMENAYEKAEEAIRDEYSIGGGEADLEDVTEELWEVKIPDKMAREIKKRGVRVMSIGGAVAAGSALAAGTSGEANASLMKGQPDPMEPGSLMR